ncbi:MAG TPA: hypothetical protein VEQ85_09030 [Lacipirellulaceae bacterium]|nr:hypothetical protein [Lacipirellulaceae bacterium]
MLTDQERQAVASTTRVTQVIVLSLVAGVGAFLLFVLTQAEGDEPAAEAAWGGMIPLAAALAPVHVLLAGGVTAAMAGAQRRSLVQGRTPATNPPGPTDAGMLLGGLQVRRIVAGALLEGAAFFNLVVYMQSRSPFNLAAVVGLLIALVALVPLRPLVEAWLEKELRTVRELRQLAG